MNFVQTFSSSVAGFLLLFFNAIAIPGEVLGQNFPETMIAVIDFQTLERDALAARNIRSQMETYRSQYAAIISKEEEQLRQLEQELKRQRTILSPEAFSQRRRGFEDSVARLQRQVQHRTRRLERSIETSLASVNKVLGPIIKELSAELGFTLVLDKRQVRYFDDSFDITPVVLQRLDQRLPEVVVPPPEGE
jgi:outer membrane protein